MAKKIVSALGKFSNSTVTGNDDTYKQKNIADFTVKKKKEGKYLLARILYLVGFFCVFIAFIAILSVAFGDGYYYGILLGLTLSGIGGWMLWFFTHRYLEIEYSYAIEGGELICTEIYGNKSDKLLLRTKMPNVKKVVPYEAPYKAEIDAGTYENKIYMLSTPSTDQAYAVVYQTESGKEGLVLLEACNKTLQAFKYYNSQNTVVKEMKR